MKLSTYVARFMANQGIRHVFAVSGGASLHLIHSVEETDGIEFVCPGHEQAGAMAADGYARVTRGLGAAIATSGPGATNLITGICCAYYDSVPTLFLTGNVASFRSKGKLDVRQMGFQETETVEMCKSITKYAVRVDDASRIRFHLEKACHLAKTGRPGPVLVDIPDDIQRAEINPEALEGFVPEPAPVVKGELEAALDKCLEMIFKATRPVLILGWGVRLSNADDEARKLVDLLEIPVVPTWGIMDLIPHDSASYVGTFGTHGTRHGNFTVQNADLILSVGCRLDTHESGSPFSSFAREARKIVVDIAPGELEKFHKFGMDVDLTIQSDARHFLSRLIARLEARKSKGPDTSAWRAKIKTWKEDFPVCPEENFTQKAVNPYVFVKSLSKELPENEQVFIDTGCSIAWMMQAFDVKRGQRLYHDFNNTAMGYALPAAIGASFGLNRKRIICVTGDGSLMMNIQELATAVHHKLPIKVFLLNNHGYSMIQQTQDQWLGSNYLASSAQGGLALPDFVPVAAAFGFKTFSVQLNAGLQDAIRETLDWDGPAFCNVEVEAAHRVIPQVKYGRPIEDSEPLLSREKFLASMVVKPMDVSLR